MANKDNSKTIRIYGVTLADLKFRVRPYGHGLEKVRIKGKWYRIQYVDYFIDDLIALIKQQKKEKEFIKKLKDE